MKELLSHLNGRSLAVCVMSTKVCCRIGKENALWRPFCSAVRIDRLKTLATTCEVGFDDAMVEIIERCKQQPDGEPAVLEKGQVWFSAD